jgi:hypothetical protein
MAESRAEDFSVQEKFDQAHVPSRPIAWVMVAIIVIGSIVGGVALIVAQPWLFYVGAGIVVFGAILGWATHALRETAPEVVPVDRHSAVPESMGGR